MPDYKCDILIVGGGVGGCAAAMAAASLGKIVLLVEETDWIGGQLTSQAVPPDEHPWIEHFGCTARYRRFREGVRSWYGQNRRLSAGAKAAKALNPGMGWVSPLCFEPRVGLAVLQESLAAHEAYGNLRLLTRHRALSVLRSGDRIDSVLLMNLEESSTSVAAAGIVLDATETGELLALAEAESVVGSESRSDTGEAHAPTGPSQSGNVQGFTWCFALGWDPHGDHTIAKPAQFERWKSYRPIGWPGPLLGWEYPNPITGKIHSLPLFSKDGKKGLFEYRRIVAAESFADSVEEATIVNWPQNDFFEGNILDAPPPEVERFANDAKQLSLSLLYWLQTEAPRPDGGAGFPGLRMRPDLTGTADGFAKSPYIRESRRIKALFTIKEQHVSSQLNPGKIVADALPKSVGCGAYRIDLHPSSSGAGYVDIGSMLFQIPLGALIPVRLSNLLPACKNIGTTHITNGCYRLHPVEWNIGESAGLLAAFCLTRQCSPHQVHDDEALFKEFQKLVWDQGIETDWPNSGDAIGLHGNQVALRTL